MQLSRNEFEVYRALQECGEWVSTKVIAEMVGRSTASVCRTLLNIVAKGFIDKRRADGKAVWFAAQLELFPVEAVVEAKSIKVNIPFKDFISKLISIKPFAIITGMVVWFDTPNKLGALNKTPTTSRSIHVDLFNCGTFQKALALSSL